MSIKLGGGGSTESSSNHFSRRNGRRLTPIESTDAGIVSEINITPLTDVFLVLLIIFMVTSSVMSQMGINVNLPNSKHAATATDSTGVIVTVTSDGTLYIDGQKIAAENLHEAFVNALARTVDKTVVLEGDRQAILGTVVQVMDEAKKAGASKFAVATSGGAN